jgi:dihydroxyacid dehydratase/phosphogluconate dehydratase
VGEVIASLDAPLGPEGGLAVVRGNLCPDGAVIKHVAASPHLLRHRGRALVFGSLADLAARIDDPALEVTPGDVLVLQNQGPVGGPGMPEVGNLPIPKKLLAQGVRDMVRISDARMSGTSYGTIVLHVAPESATGGPLAAVRTGDELELDVPADERRGQPAHGRPRVGDAEDAAREDRVGPAAELDRVQRLELDDVAQQAHRARPDEDLVRSRLLL